MNSSSLFSLSQGVIRAGTVDEAGAALKEALATGPKLRTIRLLLDSKTEEIMPWLKAVRAASPEIRGLMVQRLFARIFTKAGYDVVIGKELDIFARSRIRSLFVEVKSSLAGGRFGSQAEITQLAAYLIASERRRAEIWLGVSGIERPVCLYPKFAAWVRSENIGLIDVRWVSPEETLLPYFASVL